MTRDELGELDAQLDAETISEEEYCDTLRSEVSRLHPDYDDCDVQNMVRMQLRVMALETMLSEDNNAARVVERGPVPRGWDAGRDGPGEDRPSGGVDPQPGGGGEGSGEVAAEQEQGRAPFEPDQKGKDPPKNGQDEVSSGGPSKSSGRDEGKSQERGREKDQKNKSKRHESNNWWWTWQIVPESLIFGSQEIESEPEHEPEPEIEHIGDNPTGKAEANPQSKDESEGDVIDAEFEEIKY